MKFGDSQIHLHYLFCEYLSGILGKSMACANESIHFPFCFTKTSVNITALVSSLPSPVLAFANCNPVNTAVDPYTFTFISSPQTETILYGKEAESLRKSALATS